MTKKHFIRIAADLKRYVDQTPEIGIERGILRGIANDLCDTFKSDNPAFDKARFIAACGF